MEEARANAHRIRLPGMEKNKKKTLVYLNAQVIFLSEIPIKEIFFTKEHHCLIRNWKLLLNSDTKRYEPKSKILTRRNYIILNTLYYKCNIYSKFQYTVI